MAQRQDEHHLCPRDPSYLSDQDVSYPVDDEDSVMASFLQRTLPFPLKQTKEVLRVKIYQVI